MTKKTLLMITILLFSACSYLDQPKVSITFPVTESSVDDVMNFFNSLDPRNEISVRYVPFDEKLDSHPSIVGFVKISGNAEVNGVGHTKESLSSYVNGLKSKGILPSNNISWKRDGNEFRWLEEYVRKNEKRGIRHQYIVLSKDTLTLLYNNHESSIPDPMLEGVEKKIREMQKKGLDEMIFKK